MSVSEDTISVTITYEEACAITAIVGGLKYSGMMDDLPLDLQMAARGFLVSLHNAVEKRANESEAKSA